MVRIFVGIVLTLVAGFVGLLQLEVLNLPVARFTSRESAEIVASRALLEATKQGDIAGVLSALSQGADVRMRDANGMTPLMQAASLAENDGAIVKALLEADSNPNETSNGGMTPLIYAVQYANSEAVGELVTALLQAGADPTFQDDTGRDAHDYATASATVADSPEKEAILATLERLVSQPFDPRWPSGYGMPLAGATFSSRQSHLPNARRAYRNGYHQGFDFYDGVVSVSVSYGLPTVAVADGTVVRIDKEYTELTSTRLTKLLDEAHEIGYTSESTLDLLRGRQVWLEHAGGYQTRYVHLADVPDELAMGSRVAQGDVIGYVGNSGTDDGAEGNEAFPHLHFEVWHGDKFLGQGLEPAAIYDLTSQVFGPKSLPPYVE